MKRLALILLIFLLFPVSAQQQVEEISKMKVTVTLNGKAHVRYDITIRNLVDNPLVPGIGEIRLQKLQPLKLGPISLPLTEERVPVSVENVKVYSGNKRFRASVENAGDYTVVRYEIWYPIEPKGYMNFTVEFDADVVDEGLLFRAITIPVGTEMNIRKLEVIVIPPEGWHLSYAEPPLNGGKWELSVPPHHIVFLTAEYSKLPLPQMPVRGYLLFWGSLALAMLALAVAGLMRK